MTLSELIATAEGPAERIARRDHQPVWTDPDMEYTRRAVSPTGSTLLQLIEIELSRHTRVAMPREACSSTSRSGVLAGRLRFTEGSCVHDLRVGDCLQLGEPRPCVFHNPEPGACRYLVALRKR